MSVKLLIMTITIPGVIAQIHHDKSLPVTGNIIPLRDAAELN